MESFSVATELNLEDWNAYRRAVSVVVQSSVKRSTRIGLFILIAGFTFAVLAFDLPVSLGSFAFGASATLIFVMAASRIKMGSAHRKQKDSFLGPCSYECGAVGILVSGKGVRSEVEWSRITQVAQASNQLLLWLPHSAGFVIPIRNLPPGISPNDAISR